MTNGNGPSPGRPEENTHGIILSCLGCGFAVVVGYKMGEVLAIACAWCGAGAPILVGKGPDGPVALTPESLLGQEVLRPHLEWWLGYSDWRSEKKTETVRALRERGAVSQAECPMPNCNEAYAKGIERWKKSVAERLREADGPADQR